MKNLYLALITILTFSLCSGQSIEKLSYCNCVDKIDQLTPMLDGKFERVCNSKVIETGIFKSGKKDGEWVSYNKKGVVLKKVNYLNGQLSGTSQIFFTNGTPRLNANFNLGEKVGKWTYYTSKGKILIDGEFESGKPINSWTVYDKKGKAPLIQYDFNSAKYLINQTVELHKDNDIVQNDNTGEYYILRYPKRPISSGTLPFGGLYLSSDLFVELMEVPLDYWDTYINYKYTAKFFTNADNKTTIALEQINNHTGDNVPLFPFIIRTNDDNKLKKVNHSDLSKQLLSFKILETLNFYLRGYLLTNKKLRFISLML